MQVHPRYRCHYFGYLAGKGCNIIDSAQFDDLDTGRFFMRVSFISEEGVLLDELCDGFAAVAAPVRDEFQFLMTMPIASRRF
ncbi:hypothetical protein VXQ18_03630 [Brucella abortus]|nr:hypothetical protein [Brucella abortus]